MEAGQMIDGQESSVVNRYSVDTDWDYVDRDEIGLRLRWEVGWNAWRITYWGELLDDYPDYPEDDPSTPLQTVGGGWCEINTVEELEREIRMDLPAGVAAQLVADANRLTAGLSAEERDALVDRAARREV